MPICKREGFENVKNKKEETFNDNESVYFCEVTKEIFRHYEDYFRHVMAINSTVWQCEATGRENLTYAEALKSERKARQKMELFKESLRAPVMLVIEHAKQSSFNSLNAIVSKFLRKRFFLSEEVTACNNSTTYFPYKVVGILPADGDASPSDNVVYDATEQLQYKLKRIGNKENEILVPFEKIRRHRQEFSSENLAMFIKDNITRVDGILRPKPESYKKYIIDQSITFDKVFIGKMPHFTPSKIKPQSSKKEVSNSNKKQSSINKYLVKNGQDERSSSTKLSTEEQAKKEKKKAEKAEAKAKSLKEEMERLRHEKQEKMLALERQKAQRREQLIERVEKECNELLTKTDDLERTDQRLLPHYSTVNTLIPIKYLEDALMLREFMYSFASILSSIEVFRNNISFYELSRAFTMREVAGPLSDIFLILLGTIFDQQKEEEERCPVEYLKLREDQRRHEPYKSMSLASKTHYYARRHFMLSINQLPLDAQTFSEVLRLHLLSSGAYVKERCEKWRIMYRNGYSSTEDPGLMLRMQNAHILRLLKYYSVYQLPMRDIICLLHCLISQVLTYSAPINLIEERLEQSVRARVELRSLTIIENKRLAQTQTQRKALTCEYHQQCMEMDVKNDADKMKQLEEKLNKKVDDLLTQSKREQKKHEAQVEKLNTSLFDFMVYLGSDRAYRKYYVFESMPGVFVEHIPDSMDEKCLNEPPTNCWNSKFLNQASNLPRTRKDLRAYLLRMYMDEDKQAAAKEKLDKHKKQTQENKENLENQLTNGTQPATDTTSNTVPITNCSRSEDVNPTVNGMSTTPTPTPTQYELYMCSGDPNNCIVHDVNNSDRQRWAYLYTQEEIEGLIAALNPLGERESQLLEQLQTLQRLIIKHSKACPTDLLSINDNKFDKFKSLMVSETSKKYWNSNLGFPENADINEVMYSTLVDRILQFERDIYTGDLGRLRVKNMDKWREDVLHNTYDPQVKLQWGPTNQKLLMTNVAEKDEEGDDESEAKNTGYADDDDDEETDTKDSGKYANKPYLDPGASLGDNLEMCSDDSSDRGACLHEMDTLQQCVKNLSSALLQIEQAVERRFLKEPFGVTFKGKKDKEALERQLRISMDRLKQWEVSLMESTSYSQVFLHLNILHDSIMWARSTNKSICQVCRRGSEPDKMLLCDECNGGTHTFCMKPKLKKVPEGNWYCRRCITSLGLKNEPLEDVKKKPERKPKREFIIDDVENGSEISSVSSAVSNSNCRRTRDRHSNRRLQAEEIEELLVNDDDEESEEPYADDDEYQQESYNDGGEETLSDDEEETVENTEDSSQSEIAEEEDEEEEEQAQEDEQSEQQREDDENVCVVCSYDGGEITCCRCNDSFHLECVDLKRPPRYSYICSTCRTKEERKRRSKALDNSSDEDTGGLEPSAKRSRAIRTSQRNSAPNGSATEERSNNNNRRSHRRTAENLPLDSSLLYELLDDIIKHENAWPFLRPVLQSEVPDYYKIIKNPMDFAKVKSKLNMGEYQLNEEVLRDIQLVFQNCDMYNPEGNEIYVIGSALERLVIERCRALKLPYNPSDMNS